MKKLICLIAVFAMLLTLCACKGDDKPEETTTQPAETTIPTTTVPPTIIPIVDPTEASYAPTDSWTQVYAGAVRDYLNPVEEFSWERQYDPEFVMIHFSSAVVNHRNDPYNIKHLRKIYVDYDVSVHYVIERDGTVHCYIPEERVAWHAGRGSFGGDAKYTNKMNLYAIGIELLAMGTEDEMSAYLTTKEYHALDKSLIGFSDAQYASLKALVEDICSRQNIPLDRQHVIGHEDYSPDMNDPGDLFDWSKILP